MADMAILIDTTKCTGCRGCQVACKQWNCLPWEKGKNRKFFAHRKRHKKHRYGPGYQNPHKLTPRTWTLVKFGASGGGKDLDSNGNWNFLKFQCMHCINAPCMMVCPLGAIKRSPEGFTYIDYVLCKPNKCDTGLGPMCANGCPFRAVKVGKMPYLATITLNDVQVDDTIDIGSPGSLLTFTAKGATNTAAREFSQAGDDTADAGELVTCVNDAANGVPGVTASNTGEVITLRSCTVKVKVNNAAATFTVGSKKAYKCRGCYDRAGYFEPAVPPTPGGTVDLIPACVKTCPTDAMDYDTRANIVAKAQARATDSAVLAKWPNAETYNIAGKYGGGHVIYVLTQPPGFFGLPDLGT